MSQKCICDICGAEADQTEFVIPIEMMEYIRNSKNVKLVPYYSIEPKHVNLCKDCQSDYATFFGVIKYLREESHSIRKL